MFRYMYTRVRITKQISEKNVWCVGTIEIVVTFTKQFTSLLLCSRSFHRPCLLPKLFAPEPCDYEGMRYKQFLKYRSILKFSHLRGTYNRTYTDVKYILRGLNQRFSTEKSQLRNGSWKIFKWAVG